jgi:hypothetical protein
MNKFYSANVIEAQDGSGDMLLEFDKNFLEDSGWRINDEISIKLENNKIVLRNVTQETLTRFNNKL